MAISTISQCTSTRPSNNERLRQTLLIYLYILFAFDLFYLVFIVHAYIDHVWFKYYFQNNYELIWTLVSVFHDAFGLIVTHQSSRLGLQLFTWFGTLILILTPFMIGSIFLISLLNPKIISMNRMNLLGHVIFVLTFIISEILLFIVISLAYKLLKFRLFHRIATTETI